MAGFSLSLQLSDTSVPPLSALLPGFFSPVVTLSQMVFRGYCHPAEVVASSLGEGEVLVDGPHRGGALAHGGSDTLRRTRTEVTNGEQPWAARFER